MTVPTLGIFVTKPKAEGDAPRDGPIVLHVAAIDGAMEDNLADVLLMEEALAVRGLNTEFKNVRDGEDAIDLIRRIDADGSAPYPALSLLDLYIPTKNSEEVLAVIRSSRRCARTPVIVITSSNSPRDRESTERLGAKRYFCKPTDLDAFTTLGGIVEELLQIQ